MTRLFTLIALALLVPGVPLVLLGLSFEDRLTGFLQETWQPELAFWTVVGVLSADLLLPVPSSAVSTYAGSMLGAWQGGLAVWLGMTVGAVLGFLISRNAGPVLLKRLASPEDLARLRELSRLYGGNLLIITRPLPLLAEAAVVLAGSIQQPWSQFLIPVGISNAFIAVAYVVLGSIAEKGPWLNLALVLSVIVPLATTWAVRRLIPTSPRTND
jgi:uncharacterized membrane protein YdjX (TVP38/TMEM64 family)